MAAAKKGGIKATPPRRLKRAAKPTRIGTIERIKPYALAIGTPKEMNDQIQAGKLVDGKWTEIAPKLAEGMAADRFMTEAAAKEAAVKFLIDKIPWCERFNKAGVAAIEAAVKEVREMPVLISEPRRVVCCYDEYTNMRMAVQLWCCDPDAAEENARNRK